MSGKVTGNGRQSYPELRKSFEKVHVKYDKHEDGTVRTTGILVRDGVVHVGVSLFSNRTYQFSKSKGRNMALGRAEHAANVFHGIETVRESKEKRREELSYSIISTEDKTVDAIITEFLGTQQSK